jgi:hypothetical protein
MAITGKLTTIDLGNRVAGQPQLVEMGEATSQTYGSGWPLKVNASGFLQACVTNDTIFYGFAAAAGQNLATDGAKNARCYKISPDVQFEGTLSHTSVAVSLIGSHVGFQTNASSIAWLDTANATSKFVIRGISARFSAGDSRARVYFSVMPANIQDEI